MYFAVFKSAAMSLSHGQWLVMGNCIYWDMVSDGKLDLLGFHGENMGKTHETPLVLIGFTVGFPSWMIPNLLDSRHASEQITEVTTPRSFSLMMGVYLEIPW